MDLEARLPWRRAHNGGDTYLIGLHRLIKSALVGSRSGSAPKKSHADAPESAIEIDSLPKLMKTVRQSLEELGCGVDHPYAPFSDLAVRKAPHVCHVKCFSLGESLGRFEPGSFFSDCRSNDANQRSRLGIPIIYVTGYRLDEALTIRAQKSELIFVFYADLPDILTVLDYGRRTPTPMNEAQRLLATRIPTLAMVVAQYHAKAGNLDEAIFWADQSRHRPQATAAPFILLGQLHYKKQEWKMAGQCLDQALRLAPRNPIVLGLLINIASRTGDVARARQLAADARQVSS